MIQPVTSRTVGAAGPRRWDGPAGAERAQVAAHGLVAAAVALGADLFGEAGGVGAALGPPLVQVRLELVEQAGPLQGFDQQLVQAGGVGEPAHRGHVQFQSEGDRGSDTPRAYSSCTACIALLGPGHDRTSPGLVAVAGCSSGVALCRVGRSAGRPGSVQGGRRGGASTVFSTCSQRLCHRCHRSATWIASGAPRRAPSAYPPPRSRQITSDAWMRAQPGGERVGLPIGEQVDWPVGAHVHQRPFRTRARGVARSRPPPASRRWPISGSGSARTRRSNGRSIHPHAELRGKPSPDAARERPARWPPESGGAATLRRPWRVVNPSTCSANVTRYAPRRRHRTAAAPAAGS